MNTCPECGNQGIEIFRSIVDCEIYDEELKLWVVLAELDMITFKCPKCGEVFEVVENC